MDVGPAVPFLEEFSEYASDVGGGMSFFESVDAGLELFVGGGYVLG